MIYTLTCIILFILIAILGSTVGFLMSDTFHSNCINKLRHWYDSLHSR